jgi:DNA-binding transcriptional MerR regulator
MPQKRPAETDEMTIGRLARSVGVSTSMLRFYEKQGLIRPARRTPAGYRVYGREAEDALRFIHRAQRLGFSLTDIRHLLDGPRSRRLKGQAVRGLAHERLLEIERRMTELLVLRHELELFLEDLADQIDDNTDPSGAIYRKLVDQICGHSTTRAHRSSLAALCERLGCSLAKLERDRVLDALRGRHLHVWRQDGGYAILVTNPNPAVLAALERIASVEAGCQIHVQPKISSSNEGVLFTATGSGAFLFAQFFLALESMRA